MRGSHAVCVRGLKHFGILQDHFLPDVARRVRAWIETLWSTLYYFIKQVARRVRAWIETLNGERVIKKTEVARRVRAWIET